MQAKYFGTILLSALTAVAASYFTIHMSGIKNNAPAAPAKGESVYDRVMKTGTLRCGYSPWPPYWEVDPNSGVITGLSKDMSDATAKLMDIKIDYVQITNGQQVQDLNSGKIDAMCGDGPWVISTIKFIDYTKSYDFGAVYAYGRAAENRFQTLEDLNKPEVSFTGIDGDLSSDLVQSNFPQAKIGTMSSNTDPSQLMLNVTTGKADITITDPLTASLFIKNNPGQLKMLINQPIAVYGVGFSVKKGETELLNMLNQGVDAVINTGAADRALKKYDPDGTFFLKIVPPYQKP